MPPLFSITAATDNVRLENGQGQATFTATNVSNRNVKGRARLVAQDPASKPWLKLSGEEEEVFSVNATRQFVVKVTVPDGSKTGKYTFRLNVVDVDKIDEEEAEGPTVAFEVKQQPQRETFPWWILAVGGAVFLIIIGVVLYIAFRSKPAPEPNSGAATQGSSQPPGGQQDTAVSPGSRYGPDTCKQGFVWREAVPNDHVCVTAQVRAQAAFDNRQASARRNPTGGRYGPDTCTQGFVWRQATPNDHVCVPVQTRTQTAADNAQAANRRQSP
jgi:hypothetical protein